MPVISRDQFRVSVIIYPEDVFWIAQGVQYDITARGRTPTEASERFNDKFGAELVMSIELGDENPLSGVGPAPQEFVKMYENATNQQVADVPIRLSEGTTTNVHQEIRISDRPHAA